MYYLLALWLPILLSAVVVFVISSLIHMVFKWHAADYHGLANEDAVRAAIRAGNPAPGGYVVPYCKEMKDMASEAMVRKYREGPVAHILVGANGAPSMGKHLGLWFLWNLIVSLAAAFVVTQLMGLAPSRARASAKLAGTVTLLAYGFGSVTESIWMMRPWSVTAKNLLDAILYALGTGAIYFWLWPE